MPLKPRQPNSPDEQIEAVIEDYESRREFAKSLLGFGLIYFSHYLYLPPGDFHKELISALEDFSIDLLEVIGFRGSSKTVWGSLITPIWLALEHADRFPFIICVANTLSQSTANLANIKYELESNQLLRNDYGKLDLTEPFESAPKLESEDEWQKQNILISNGVRILARTTAQKVRGLRHRQFRPRAAILDDPEDQEWVRTKENRDKTERYITGELLPAMDEHVRKFVLIGNYLHNDAIMVRMKSRMKKVLEIPLIKDGNGTEIERCTWLAKYPTQESLDKKKIEMGTVSWMREMCLKIVPDEDQIIKPEDIHYYDALPKEGATGIKGHGIDLAISLKENADYTAIVDGDTYYIDEVPKVFIKPNPFNRHVSFHDFIKHAKSIATNDPGGAHIFYVEDVAFQKAAIQEMERNMLPVVPMRPTADKRSRLQVVAIYIKNGSVLFPRTGCEELLGQVFNLGVETNDDLVDAAVYLVQGLVNGGLELPKVQWLDLAA